MTVRKPLSVILLIATILPFIYIALFFISLFSEAGDDKSVYLFGSFDTMLTLHLLTMLLLVAIPVFYVTHAFNNERLSSEKRTLWVLVLIFGSSFSASVYWFHYIWKRPTPVG